MILKADRVCAFTILFITVSVIAVRSGTDAGSVAVHEAVA
jgi:hypothetical protein